MASSSSGGSGSPQPVNGNPASVRYKTYQSKRNSAGSLYSLTGRQEATPTKGPSSFHRPSQSQSQTQAQPQQQPSSAAAVSQNESYHTPRNSQHYAPSPLSRVNPSTNDLDRFPRSPPPTSSPKLTASPSLHPQDSNPNPKAASSSASSSGAVSRPSSANSGSSTPRAAQKAPYLAGFQAKGVSRLRTEEFYQARKAGSESKRLEHARLQRRLEKLVDLHFPHPASLSQSQLSEKAASSSLLPPPAAELTDTLRSKPSASELWFSVRRTLKGSTLRQAEDIKAAEQRIVHWTDDRHALLCATCFVPFSLTVRKHHCRLCGRVMCNIPPNDAPPPTGRNLRCSSHFVYEWLSDSDKAPGGVIVELDDPSSLTEEQEAAQVAAYPNSVRSCRECLDMLLRQQAIHFPAPSPTWYKLHRVLLQTQEDIERTLPGLQEQLLNPSNTPAGLLSTRKKILALLANYDALARRIRDSALGEGQHPGGSQERLQRAIATRAAGYLSEKMGLLKGLGSFEDLHSDASSPSNSSSRTSSPPVTTLKGITSGGSNLQQQQGHAKKGSTASMGQSGGGGAAAAAAGKSSAQELQATADKLAVLLEQEQLVESYLEQANAKRQLLDAAALQTSLDELRHEIAALRQGS